MRRRSRRRSLSLPQPLPSCSPLTLRERLRLRVIEREIRRGHRRGLRLLADHDVPVPLIECPGCGRDLYTVGAMSLHLRALHDAVLDLAAQGDFLRHEMAVRHEEQVRQR